MIGLAKEDKLALEMLTAHLAYNIAMSFRPGHISKVIISNGFIGVRRAGYYRGDEMEEPCATCRWSRPPDVSGYNAKCTRNEYDILVDDLMCNFKNGPGFQRQYEFEGVRAWSR